MRASERRGDATIRRRLRRAELERDDQGFLRLLATLGLGAWCLVLWAKAFPPPPRLEATEEPIRVAAVRLKPPPEEKKEEPKPEPLPPRVSGEKPPQAQAPGPKAPPRSAAVARGPSAPARRSVATLGLLGILSAENPRVAAVSQRIGPPLGAVDIREARNISEDVGTLTGTVGARARATAGELAVGLPRNGGTQVVLEGRVVTPISGPGAPSISGAEGGTSGRTLAEIRQVVASYIPGLKYLYDRELKSRPTLHGKLTVEFVIAPEGHVAEVRIVQSALDHPALENAILSRIRGWKFPEKPGDATRVTFPFDFVAPTT